MTPFLGTVALELRWKEGSRSGGGKKDIHAHPLWVSRVSRSLYRGTSEQDTPPTSAFPSRNSRRKVVCVWVVGHNGTLHFGCVSQVMFHGTWLEERKKKGSGSNKLGDTELDS